MSLASAAAENAAVTAIAAIAPYCSAHTATTSTTGASEVTGGTYARVAITWGTASAGSIANTNTVSINQPASTTVTHAGGWSVSTSGTFAIGMPLSSSVTTGGTAGTLAFAPGALTLAAS